MIDAGKVEEVFDKISTVLQSERLSVNEGQIVDASFAEVSRQRSNKVEKQL